jgi:hypothetical protein
MAVHDLGGFWMVTTTISTTLIFRLCVELRTAHHRREEPAAHATDDAKGRIFNGHLRECAMD